VRKIRFAGVPLVLFGIVAVAAMSLVVFGLWNALMPAIFGLTAISFWQAAGLLVLSRLLFGRLGWGRGRNPRFVRGLHDLSPEERQRFRRAMGSGCGGKFGEDDPAKA